MSGTNIRFEIPPGTYVQFSVGSGQMSRNQTQVFRTGIVANGPIQGLRIVVLEIPRVGTRRVNSLSSLPRALHPRDIFPIPVSELEAKIYLKFAYKIIHGRVQSHPELVIEMVDVVFESVSYLPRRAEKFMMALDGCLARALMTVGLDARAAFVFERMVHRCENSSLPEMYWMDLTDGTVLDISIESPLHLLRFYLARYMASSHNIHDAMCVVSDMISDGGTCEFLFHYTNIAAIEIFQTALNLRSKESAEACKMLLLIEPGNEMAQIQMRNGFYANGKPTI